MYVSFKSISSMYINPILFGGHLRLMSYLFTCRSGSVYAIVELVFGKPVTEPLKPLQDEIRDGKLGSFTVYRELYRDPHNIPTLSPSRLSTCMRLLFFFFFFFFFFFLQRTARNSPAHSLFCSLDLFSPTFSLPLPSLFSRFLLKVQP